MQPQNIQDISQKAEEIYTRIKGEMEPSSNGKHIAIEPESGEYFVGETMDEAVSKLREKYPDKIFFVRRIGELDKISRHLQTPSIQNRYACLL